VVYHPSGADHRGSTVYLRHKPSSPARTLGFWARIPLETWMPVCVYSVLMLRCV
jgi:hypothetical protein